MFEKLLESQKRPIEKGQELGVIAGLVTEKVIIIRVTKILPGSRVLVTTAELLYGTPIFSQCTSPERLNLHPTPALAACESEFPAMNFSVFLGPYPDLISPTMSIRCSSQHYPSLSLSTQLNNLNHMHIRSRTRPWLPPPHLHYIPVQWVAW